MILYIRRLVIYRDLSNVIGVSYDILENGYYDTNFADVLVLVDPLMDKEPKVGFAVGNVHFKSLISGLRYDIQVNKSQKMQNNFVRLNELIPIKNTHYCDVDIQK